MTRRYVYGVGLWLTIACTAMTIASIVVPKWLSYSPVDKTVLSYGLHRRCDAITGTCTHFPKYEDCTGDKWSFCSMWRTIGFFMSFSVVIELCALVSFAVIIASGLQSRKFGWKIVITLLGVGGLVQCIAMALVSFLFDHDERFFEGWHLDTSWILCTISWSLLLITGAGITAAAIYLPEEGGYELIPNERVQSIGEHD